MIPGNWAFITVIIPIIFIINCSLAKMRLLKEGDYFGRKATFYHLIADTNSRGPHFPALIRLRPHGFFFRIREIKDICLEPD